jgi:hypothetical protein
MKKCAYCGLDNVATALVCSGCGTGEFKDPNAPSLPPLPPSPARVYVTILGIVALVAVASFMSWIACIAHPDTPKDVATGKTTNCAIIAPLWALAVFFYLKIYLGGRPRAGTIALGAAILTWIGFALVLP